ncbi:hypothetical protein HOC35_01280 [Candidatus Woesearchaeota archaeon]|nr:hypothetical protein [Candidatus Woesearchaeota archaeon]
MKIKEEKVRYSYQRSNYIILIVLMICLISLGVGLFYIQAQHKQLKENYNSLDQEYSDYKETTETSLVSLSENLTAIEKEKQEVQSSLGNIEQKHKKLTERHDLLIEEVKKTIGKINVYQDEIEDSMEWVKDNSEIKNEKIEYYLRPGNCYKITEHTCRIKTGCFFFINKERLGLNYMYDYVTSNEVDQLQSIQEFLGNKGGDCEDYSLFYKAEFNYILDQCLKNGVDRFTIEAWQGSEDPEETYGVEYSNMWYIQGGTDIDLEKGYIYPNIVCGYLYDFVRGSISGHCIIGFTKEKIENINDLELLNNAPLIEPQNGIYLGKVNDESSNIFLINEKNHKELYSYINIVITDNDLYLFSDEYKEWLGYSIFNEELAETKNALIEGIDGE